MTLDFLFYAGMLAALILGIVLFRRRRTSWTIEERLLGLVVPLGLLTAAATFVRAVCTAPHVIWNGPRLAPSFALIHGYNLYYKVGEGPVLQWIYGPVAPLLYLPATLTDSPSDAISVAEILVQLFYFGPVLCLLILSQRGRPRPVLTALGVFLCFTFFTDRCLPLILASNWVHTDAPALGLGMAAAMILYLSRNPSSHATLATSAFLAVLAAWTKQPLLAVGVGLALYLWLANGRACFWRYVLWLTVSSIAVSGVFLLAFGFEAMWYNTVAILPHGIARPRGMMVELFVALQEFVLASLPLIVAIVAFSWWQRSTQPADASGNWRSYLAQNRWTLFVVVSLVNLPLCLRHRANFGGADNALSPCIYYLLTGAILALITIDGSTAMGDSWLRIVKALAAVLVAGFVCTLTLLPAGLEQAFANRRNNMSEKLFEQLKKEPGSAYVVDNPLPALMAEGKLYHFSSGIFGRDFAKKPLSKQDFWNHVPPNVQMIVFAPDMTIIDEGYAHPALRYIPEFSEKSVLPNSWVIYRRKADKAPAN